MSDEYVKVKGKIAKIRAQSILFTVGDSVPRGAWIPRSLIHGADERQLDGLAAAVLRMAKQGGVEREIRIFEWKAEEIGFITGRDGSTGDLFAQGRP